MKKSCRYRKFLTVGWLFACSAMIAPGASLQLVSVPGPGFQPAAGAAGDSYLPVVSRDGRYVLFASTAENLLAPTTNRPSGALVPRPLNVFLRDRTNNSTILVSVNYDGTGGGNGDSLPIGISTNAQFALFESRASNLVPGDTNSAPDVFLRNLHTGTTILVSAAANGGFGNGASYSSSMTPDARYVAFASEAANLVPGDTNGIPDVFVRDMLSNSTAMVSSGAQAGGWGSMSDTPVITPDGRYVAFFSTASNVAPGVTTIANVYVRDRQLGTTVWASAGALPALQSVSTVSTVSNAVSFSHAISADGRYVVFEAVGYSGFFSTTGSPTIVLRYDSQAGQTEIIDTNAVAPEAYQSVQNLSITPDARFVAYRANALDASGATTAIRVWDAQRGASTLVSVNTNQSVAAGSLSDSPVIDEGGRFIAFVSSAPDLVSNASPAEFHIYLRDLQSQSTTLVDADTNSTGSLIDPTIAVSMSEDGGTIAFHRQEGDAGALNAKRSYDVFARDRSLPEPELISAHAPGAALVTPQGSSINSSISASFDGRFVSFWSEADDLVANDTNGLRDVFVRDVVTGTTVLVSANTNGFSGNRYSTDGAISADGRFVAFTSYANDLVVGDTNGFLDVFVRDLPSGTTTLASVNASGTGPGDADSYSPLLSTNGQFVSFISQAKSLVNGLGTQLNAENLFWRDLIHHQTYALSTNQFADRVIAVSMSADGRWVAFAKGSSVNNPLSPPSQLFVWDAQSASIVYSLTGGTASFGPLAISPDGQRLVYVTNALDSMKVVALDRSSQMSWLLASYQGPSGSSPHFSDDSRFITYVAMGTSTYTKQVFLYDFQTGTNLLVSRSSDGRSPGDGDSDSTAISPDGRFVAYRSAAGNLISGITNNVPNVLLYDQSNGQTDLLTPSRFKGSASNRRCLPSLAFSGDGQSLVLSSWADDLILDDFNREADVVLLGLGNTNMAAFAVSVVPVTDPVSSTGLSWFVTPGRSYRVQFKADLQDASWQDLSSQITITGNRAYVNDSSPGNTQRFYRVVGF